MSDQPTDPTLPTIPTQDEVNAHIAAVQADAAALETADTTLLAQVASLTTEREQLQTANAAQQARIDAAIATLQGTPPSTGA